MPACDSCGADVRSDATFCVSCGASRTAGARENEPSDSVTPRTCSRCGNEFHATPGWRVCSSCRATSEISMLVRVREYEPDEAELSRRRDERRRISSTTKSCVACNETPQTILGVTISSRPSCQSCGVRYCGSCRGQLRNKKVRWWVPTPFASGKVCRECEGHVPRPTQWYDPWSLALYLFLTPGFFVVVFALLDLI
jgi:hypothetical protein